MNPVVVALGFDLFFRPKLVDAARTAGVDLRAPATAAAADAATDAARVVADVSVPGVLEALGEIRRRRPDVPIVVCYPHVEIHRAEAARALGAATVTRGAFVANLADAVGGAMDP